MKYRLYPEDWDELCERYSGDCWICKLPLKLHTDHCHDTGRVRGLLCNQCNCGHFGDDVVRIRQRLEYLEAPLPDVPQRPLGVSTPDETKHVLYPIYNGTLRSRFRSQGHTPAEWLYFEGFVLWSEANGWSPGARLLRRGNRGWFDPSNCYWSFEYLDGSWPEREKPVTAWGETKILSEWLVDSRCKIDSRTDFHARIHRGWTPERALGSVTSEWSGTAVQAFGEMKAVAEWLRDPRCGVAEGTLRWRLSSGWKAEEAITRSVKDGYEIDGVAKSATDWLKEPIAQVGSYRTLMRRLKAGWDFEQALTTADGRTRSRI